MSSFRFPLLAMAFLAFARACVAHGDLHPRIEEATASIKAAPTNAALYYQRGELYRQHGDWTNALADLDAALRLDPGLSRVYFSRGRVHLESGQPGTALPALDRYLATHTNDSIAWATRGRARAEVEQWRGAANDFTRAIALTPMGEPELYIERGQALAKAGAREDAVASLDEGIKRMGPLVTLQLQAIELETSLKRYDSALARIDLAMSRLQRKESWLVRKAQVLRLAGRTEESRQAYEQALAALERLPASHRTSRATLQLEATIQSALKE